jgi:hypothetical protein
MAYILRTFLAERGLHLKTATDSLRTMDEGVFEDTDGYSTCLATGFSIHFLLQKLFDAAPALATLADKVRGARVRRSFHRKVCKYGGVLLTLVGPWGFLLECAGLGCRRKAPGLGRTCTTFVNSS